jgi:hypothetical protein
MEQHISRLYSGCFGLVGGTLSYIDNIDEPIQILIVRTILVASVSTLTGLLFRELYMYLRRVLIKIKKK